MLDNCSDLDTYWRSKGQIGGWNGREPRNGANLDRRTTLNDAQRGIKSL